MNKHRRGFVLTCLVALSMQSISVGCATRTQAVRTERFGAAFLVIAATTVLVSGVAAANTQCSEDELICLGPVVPLMAGMMVAVPLTISGTTMMGVAARERRQIDRESGIARNLRQVELDNAIRARMDAHALTLCVGGIEPCAMARRCVVADDEYACGAADVLAQSGQLDPDAWRILRAEVSQLRAHSAE
jgi:hypothetical protein